MKANKLLVSLILACLLVAGLAAEGSQEGGKTTRLALGATNATSSHYAYFTAIAKIVNDEIPGLQASVVETGATVDNLERMQRGQLDMGLITSSTLNHAYFGKHGFAEKPIKSKLLWMYALAPQNITVRRDSGVTDLSQLDGKRFGPGMRGSSTEATSEMVFDLLNVEPDWVRGSNDELAAAIKDNRSIGFVKSAVNYHYDPLTQDIATFTPLRVLGLSDDQVSLIKKNLPEVGIVDMPGGKAEDSGPYRTHAFLIGVSAAPDLDEEIAYKIVKAIMEDDSVQKASFPGLEGVDLAQLTMDYASAPIHAGALRYYKEAGYEIPAIALEE